MIESPVSEISATPRRSFWRRAGRIYQFIAVLVLNTLVLLGIALVVAHVILPRDVPPVHKTDVVPDEMRPVGVNAVYSERFIRSAYYMMTDIEVNMLLAEMDAWAASGHWQVHPWTGLTSRFFDGQFLNINFDGIRSSRKPSAQHQDLPPLVIWFFGGSTSFGWGLSDDYTPPSQLQAVLQNLIPDRQVQVVNFAVPIYASSQELALFVANLRRTTPDIAVFLDGLNDVWFPLYAGNPTPVVDPLAGAWEASIARITSSAQQPWVTFNASFPPYRLARTLGISDVQLQPPLPYAVNYAMRGTGASNDDEELQFAIDQYSANRRMAARIGDEFGVGTFFFLQPWEDQFYPGFRAGVSATNDIDHAFDISAAFDNADAGNRLMRVDDIHYSDFASQMLAGRMAALIVANYDLE